jgi:hypothetical protein
MRAARVLSGCIVCGIILFCSGTLYGQIQPVNPPPPPPSANKTPKFPPSAGGHEINGNSSCHDWCTKGPVRFTPDTLQACVGESVMANFRITTTPPTLLANRGDGIENQGGQADWGDGETTDLAAPPLQCCTWDLTHVYRQAGSYVASAQYRQQFTNSVNPSGGCS